MLTRKNADGQNEVFLSLAILARLNTEQPSRFRIQVRIFFIIELTRIRHLYCKQITIIRASH